MIDFLLDCSLWYTSCSKLKGIVTQKPDRTTLNLTFVDKDALFFQIKCVLKHIHPFWITPTEPNLRK